LALVEVAPPFAGSTARSKAAQRSRLLCACGRRNCNNFIAVAGFATTFACSAVQYNKFSETLTNINNSYQNLCVRTLHFIEQLIAIADQFKKEATRGIAVSLISE
jgi:Domain of unknown function (DUF3387)